jgi:hypothetical protein
MRMQWVLEAVNKHRVMIKIKALTGGDFKVSMKEGFL